MVVSTLLAGCGAKVENSEEPNMGQVEDISSSPANNNSLEEPTMGQDVENEESENPTNPNGNTQYIKNGKLNYSDIMFFNCKGTNGEGTVEFMPYGPAVNELCAELKALYPDIAKSTIMNIVSPMVNVDNVDWAAKQERGIQNGDVVTIEVSVIQAKVDMWNEYFGDIELIIEPTYTTTVEGLED